MNSRLGKSLTIAAVLAATPALAQDMPDIGFKSVGRGRPLAASVHDQQTVGPGWIGGPFQRRDDQKLDGFRPDELPKRRRAAARRHLHEHRFLRRQGAVERPALLPLQQPDGDRVPARHPEPESARHDGQDGRWSLGPLRHRLSARGHRQPVRLHDGAGALRGAARRRRAAAAARASTRSRTFRPSSGTASTSARWRARATNRRGTGARTRRSRRCCRC